MYSSGPGSNGGVNVNGGANNNIQPVQTSHSLTTANNVPSMPPITLFDVTQLDETSDPILKCKDLFLYLRNSLQVRFHSFSFSSLFLFSKFIVFIKKKLLLTQLTQILNPSNETG
jgi:hypothetical protein